ncbi:hypothetical protein [Parapedobacter sp. DT-150]|uniref:hypothetical protein n=1 Tax=Parapedobacter sp. DT-150 TaxID=3396162 RepID=UPI003F540B84
MDSLARRRAFDISTGIYRFPKERAVEIAIITAKEFFDAVTQLKEIGDRYFGEGITFIGDSIYVLPP